MSKILYKADNISVIGEIGTALITGGKYKGEIIDQNKPVTQYFLSLFFTIFINGKMKSFNRQFGFSVNKGEIDGKDYFTFGDTLNLLSDLGYPILENRDDGLNYTGNILTKWIDSFIIGREGDDLIFE